MFGLQVDLLAGSFQATDYTSRERAEWPPHPERLFSALVSAVFDCGIEGGRDMLLWLESLPPPDIYASPAAPRTVCSVFVPVNSETGKDKEKRREVLPQFRSRQERTFPLVVPHEPRVYFRWPDVEVPATYVDPLATAAQNIPYLGSSSSPVAVRLVSETPPPTFIPVSGQAGECSLRIPYPGRLAYLEARFASDLFPTPGRVALYGKPQVTKRKVEATSPIRDFVVFHLDRDASLNITTTMIAAIRRELSHIASTHGVASLEDSAQLNSLITVVPLAHIGHPHALGQIKGIAALISARTSEIERALALKLLFSLNHYQLPGAGEISLRRVNPADEHQEANALQRHRWSGPWKRWASVTPVLIENPEASRDQVASSVAVACVANGFPCPTEVLLGDHSRIEGVPWVRDFARPKGAVGKLKHAVLEFSVNVHGPVVIGSGLRHGFGFFVPFKETQS